MRHRLFASFVGCASACALTAWTDAGPRVHAQAATGRITATRLGVGPVISVASSPTGGDNVNGPSVIRVPAWVEQPLGRYYMYFSDHKGTFIRLAYANAVEGPWRIHAPGVLDVRATAFNRPPPDPPNHPNYYTHVASPEIYLDERNHRIVLWVHGWWTNGEQWPRDDAAAAQWVRERGYAQQTQVATSADGVSFTVRGPITKTSYLRVFPHDGHWYGMARLGLLARSLDPLQGFELGPNPYRDGPYANRVRHVGLVRRGDVLHVFFTAIGDAPERVLHSAIPLQGTWDSWRATSVDEILTPSASYECADLPNAPSTPGEIDGPARQMRDPYVFEDGGKYYLFYTVCGEQGIAVAALTFPP